MTSKKKKTSSLVMIFMYIIFAIIVVLLCGLSGCGKKEEESTGDEIEVTVKEPVTAFAGEASTNGEPGSKAGQEAGPAVYEDDEEPVPGCYRSELTNEWIDEAIQNQRPIAVMVDNELTALPHYGTSQADIVYEMMNSTMNGRITRFMCVYKDWANVDRIGSVRSTRTTNLQIAPEYNAVVCHDGGPFYIDMFLKNPFVDNFSGGFARIDNGKSREFTEYITKGEVQKRFDGNNMSTQYNQYYQGGQHFQFASRANPIDLSSVSGAIDCTSIVLPYEHNHSKLEYVPETGKYRYSEYGKEYKDAGNGSYLEFENVIIQECKHEQLDDHGYMNFFVKQSSGMSGYYCTRGKAIPLTWSKQDDIYPTKFYGPDGEEIRINTGKTYITLCPADNWSNLKIQ